VPLSVNLSQKKTLEADGQPSHTNHQTPLCAPDTREFINLVDSSKLLNNLKIKPTKHDEKYRGGHGMVERGRTFRKEKMCPERKTVCPL